ncbi:MAG: ABC transporter ATP-binding protein/permease [Betaproteobacteria bacterium]|nr:ABC transporter ATP-binding protein/permease [Betaproteobacteria bacterium]
MPADIFGKYGALLELGARRRFYALCGLAVVAGLLEAAAVASVMPFLATVAGEGLVPGNARFAGLLEPLGASSPSSRLAWLGGAVLCLLVLANAASAATTWSMLRFANRQGHALSVRLLASYLAKPYAFYLHRNTAELQKNVFGEVYRVTSGALIPAVHIVTKLAVVFSVSALLVLVDPLMALAVAAVLGGAYAILYRFARTALQDAGQVSVEAGTVRARHAMEALAGAKEIKLLGRESQFLQRFREPSLRWADAQTRAQAISQLPRFALEAVAIGLILMIAIYLLGAGRGMGETLPLIGLYAFAGYRLMPALQLVFAGFAAIRNSQPALQAVLADLQASYAPDYAARDGAPRIPLESAVELVNVRYRYPGAAGWSLQPVDLRIARNTSVALVGTTGCGKTTVVDLLMGLLRPEGGSLRVDGVDIDDTKLPAWQRSIGHVPQQIFLCDDSIARNIAFGLPDAEIDRSRVEHAAKLARLHDFVTGSLPKGYDTVVGERGIRLSGGQRQRIGIARALYADPDLLVLDEATSALDNVTENAVLEALQALAGRKTIVMVAHRLSTVRACDLICVMEQGRIVERGRYEELIGASPRFQALAAAAGA